MKNKKLIERIVLNPKVMVGKPVIRGTRLTVDFILNLLAHGRRHPRLLPIRNQSPERYRLYASVGGAHLIKILVDECTQKTIKRR